MLNVAALLRRALPVDPLGWNLLDKRPHRVKVGFINTLKQVLFVFFSLK